MTIKLQRSGDTTALSFGKMQGLFCDATFQIHSREFPIHRVILSATSDYFRSLFENAHKFSEKDGKYLMPETNPCAFQHIIDYIYTGTCTLNDNHELRDLLQTAHQYQVTSLMCTIETWMSKELTKNKTAGFVTMRMLLDVLDCADTFELQTLEKHAVDMISSDMQDFYATVLHEDTLLSRVSATQIRVILQADDINCSEVVVFEIAKAWVNCERSFDIAVNEKSQVLQLVRYAYIPPKKRKRILQDSTITSYPEALTKSLINVMDAIDAETVGAKRRGKEVDVKLLKVDDEVTLMSDYRWVRQQCIKHQVGWGENLLSSLGQTLKIRHIEHETRVLRFTTGNSFPHTVLYQDVAD